MADKVVINIDGKQVEIPEFAYDRSILQIEQQLKKMNENLSKMVGFDKVLKQQGKAELKLSQDEKVSTDKTLDVLKKTVKQDKKASDEQLKQLKENGKQQGVVNKALAATGGSGGVFSGLFGGLTKFSKFLNPVTAGLAGLANGIIAVTKFFLKLGQLDNQLFRRGFNTPATEGTAQGVASFAIQAANASLSLDQFAELIQEFGITAGEFGTQAISKAIIGVQNLTEEQGYLGLSNQELAAATLESAEVLRQLGFSSEIGSNEIAKQTVEVLRNTQSFTRLTNVSNDVIRNLTIQASQLEAFTNALQMLPMSLRANALRSSQTAFAGLAAFGEEAGGQLTTALSEGIGRGGLQFTQFGQDLARVSPALLTSLQDLQNASANGGDVVGALDDFRNAIGNVDENSREFLRALEISGDPMAKFVIKLANLNDTIDDVTFKQMAALRDQISPNELGKAQAQLRLAIEKVRTAFQKLLIAFMTPEVVKGFSIVVDNVVDALTGIAGWLKTDGFGMLQDAFNKLVGFFGNVGGGIAGIFDSLSGAVSGSISAGISRGIAIAVAGGTNEEDLAKYDKMVAGFKGAGSEAERNKLIAEAYKSMGGRKKVHPSEIDPNASLGFAKPVAVNQEYMRKFLQKQMGGYFAGDIFGGGAQGGAVDPGLQEALRKQGGTATNNVNPFAGGGATSRSKIRIMPMFGDSGAMVEEKSASEKIQILLQKQNELMEENIALQKRVDINTKKNAEEAAKSNANAMGSVT